MIRIILVFIFVPQFLFSQKDTIFSLDEVWKINLNTQRSINKSGMYTLLGWSCTNIVTGTIASTQTEGSAHYFHQMNAMWNTVNLGLSIGGLVQERKLKIESTQDLNTRQKKLEKIFLINGGLDLVYMGVGTGLLLSKNETDTKQGYGQSLLLQGGFLMLFDGTMYFLHRNNRIKYDRNIEFMFGFQSVGVRFTIQ
jgi:hypothetical protein